jgi:hypothetical protein
MSESKLKRRKANLQNQRTWAQRLACQRAKRAGTIRQRNFSATHRSEPTPKTPGARVNPLTTPDET